MKSFIFYHLIILLTISLFTQFYYYDTATFSSDETQTQNLAANQTLNGTSQELELEQGSLDLGFNMTYGLVTVIVSAIALGLIGLNVLGSGLSDFSVKIIWNGIVFYGLWLIFSVLSYSSIVSIPTFGIIFWFLLTFVYTLGIFNMMGSD